MMKNRILLASAFLLLCFAACKKENKNPDGKIVGKWYEEKLEIKMSNGTAVDHDTTFAAASFTKDDYFQFTSDKKAVFSQSGIYSVTGKEIAISGGTIDIGMAHYTWAIADSTLTLNNTDRFPTALSSDNSVNYQLQTIIQLDANNLVLRTQYFSGVPLSQTTTAYFKKGK